MSRPGPSATRNLSLTEELERLEQSITLTLQEIDRNFSRAHRIVTTSILPLVEQYGEHSRAVWEASKFWKQFFEASANVSLSGYEELAADEDTTVAEETTVHDETTADYTPRPHGDDTTITTDQTGTSHAHAEDSLLDDGDGDLSGSTPRPPATKSLKPLFADLDSPYEALKRELKGGPGGAQAVPGDESETETPLMQHTARLPDMSMTPRSSLEPTPGGAGDDDIFDLSTAKKSKDPLLHRVLDKNYRIQATPHRNVGVSPIKWRVTEKPPEKDVGKGKDREVPLWQDSPMSSPEMAVPTLRAEAFMSPVRAAYRSKLTAAVTAPRTPGVSVQTPATGKKVKDVFASEGTGEKRGRDKYEISWDSDEDDEDLLYGGKSPPKTIQFALPPSKLLQTPAREASKRIVEDILFTAGAPMDDSEYSPTMVKMNKDILDDTF
ncbi:DASH complex subunit ask1 [Pleurostoma richardsiae]|uniref:DASH complex subunit ASK1 n=1 Tax=Pleurostoma richardsiae TaxID=41990 RepID=A0AA38RGS9_9PEZI|nr:DASH complex subunit ask1 [Pleurostoma richardsiae]